MSNTEFKRNTMFIQKAFQMRSIMTVVGIIAASGLLSGVLMYFMLSSELSSELQMAHNQLQNTWDSLAPAIIFGNIVTVIVTGLVASVAVLYQSHKIAGPMYRLKTICDEVSRGNYNPVSSLRKADQLTELATSFEKMLDALRKKNSNNEDLLNEANRIIDEITEQVDNKSLVNELKKTLDNISNVK